MWASSRQRHLGSDCLLSSIRLLLSISASSPMHSPNMERSSNVGFLSLKARVGCFTLTTPFNRRINSEPTNDKKKNNWSLRPLS